MSRRQESVHSAHLDHTMEYLWFGESGRPLVLFPTSAGRYNENEDFGLVGAVQDKIDAGEIQVISLDSVNRESWADDDLPPDEKLRRHALYDRFLAEEFFPMVASRTGRDDPIVYGASLGGWQAATFGARHPELVGRVIAFSGFFTIRQLVDDWWSEEAYFYSPEHFVPNMGRVGRQAVERRLGDRDRRAGHARRRDPQLLAGAPRQGNPGPRGGVAPGSSATTGRSGRSTFRASSRSGGGAGAMRRLFVTHPRGWAGATSYGAKMNVLFTLTVVENAASGTSANV